MITLDFVEADLYRQRKSKMIKCCTDTEFDDTVLKYSKYFVTRI